MKSDPELAAEVVEANKLLLQVAEIHERIVQALLEHESEAPKKGAKPRKSRAKKADAVPMAPVPAEATGEPVPMAPPVPAPGPAAAPCVPGPANMPPPVPPPDRVLRDDEIPVPPVPVPGPAPTASPPALTAIPTAPTAPPVPGPAPVIAPPPVPVQPPVAAVNGSGELIAREKLVAVLNSIAAMLSPEARTQMMPTLLQPYGVERVSELPPANYAAVLEAAQAMVQKEAH